MAGGRWMMGEQGKNGVFVGTWVNRWMQTLEELMTSVFHAETAPIGRTVVDELWH